MAQNAKYRIVTLDEHYTFWYDSNCGNCEHLVDGLCYFTCDKHPDKIPQQFWNNEKNCPDKKETSEYRPYRE